MPRYYSGDRDRDLNIRIIRQTIERTSGHGLRPHELEKAVANGAAIMDAGNGHQQFGDIARAAIAVTKNG